MITARRADINAKAGTPRLTLAVIVVAVLGTVNCTTKPSASSDPRNQDPPAANASAEASPAPAPGNSAPPATPSADANKDVPSTNASSEIPPDWSTFTVKEYDFKIEYPSNWPTNLSGNVLTIGDTKGDGHNTCYLTIEFQGSKNSGIIPAPTTHSSYEDMQHGEQCASVLPKIVKTGKFMNSSK
jgi:hypothetical protein